MATGATPGSGSGAPSSPRTRTMSPSASTSRWPGRVRSLSTVTRPARSVSAPVRPASLPASGDAATPAAQMTVRVAMRSASPSAVRTVTESSSMSITVRFTSGVTPRRLSEEEALADSDGGKVVSTRSAASISSIRPLAGSIWRKSWRIVSWAISAIWPAISTPVGPAPTSTNVSQAARRWGSGSISAASNAARMRRLTCSALSSVFTSDAWARQSSWPK